MKTLKQQLQDASAIQHNDLSGEYDDISIDVVLLVFEKWLEQKPTIPKTLCSQLCKHACKLCLLDDALSRQELLEELKT